MNAELARITYTDNEPDVFTPPPTRPDVDSWIAVVSDYSRLATLIAPTEFVPKALRDSAPATAAAILYGRELGMEPMTALTQLYVIDGKPSMYAEAMRAMVLARGHEIAFDETTGATCTIRGRRRGSQHWTTVTWTIDMARAAGLTNRGFGWKNDPRAMLIARASSQLCRMVFPDVIHGLYAKEELEDVPNTTGGGGSEPVARQGTRTVQRARAATETPSGARDRVPPASSHTETRQAPEGASQPPQPPLPGEPGYDQESTGESPAYRRRVITDELLQGVASVYTENPDAPTKAVEDRYEVSPATASRWVKQARERGHLAPLTETTRGEDTQAVPGEDTNGEPTGGESASTPPTPPAPADREHGPVTEAQKKMMWRWFRELGLDDKPREERLRLSSAIVGRELTSSNDLTITEAQTLINTLILGVELGGIDQIVDNLPEPPP